MPRFSPPAATGAISAVAQRDRLTAGVCVQPALGQLHLVAAGRFADGSQQSAAGVTYSHRAAHRHGRLLGDGMQVAAVQDEADQPTMDGFELLLRGEHGPGL
ncbi:hypothetical protein O1L44_19530 [Streptomyces noursei]|nr:hypothetical protein [Streptomyces noursei]